MGHRIRSTGNPGHSVEMRSSAAPEEFAEGRTPRGARSAVCTAGVAVSEDPPCVLHVAVEGSRTRAGTSGGREASAGMPAEGCRRFR